MTRLSLSIATGGGVGYIPFAPGTFGALVGLVLFAVIRRAEAAWLEVAAVAIVYAAGVWASAVAERHFGHRDPGPVVVDEILGMLVTLIWLPVSWLGVLAGFVLFRLFDIMKPPPCRRIETLPGGWGIMTDDLVAGLYAHVALRLLLLVVPGLAVAP